MWKWLLYWLLAFFSSFTALLFYFCPIFALHFWCLFLKCSTAVVAGSFAGFSVLHTLLPNFFLYFPFLISRHNVLSCLAHYWTLILSENFWLTEFLIALHCSWPLFQNVKFMQFPLLWIWLENEIPHDLAPKAKMLIWFP